MTRQSVRRVSQCLVLSLLCLATAGTRQTVSIRNHATGTCYRATVVTPDTYRTSQKRYPVIYLLHGFGSDYRTLARIVRLEPIAERYQTLLVCPDGDRDSWYLDSPLKPSTFDSYITKDVVGFMDSCYRTIALDSGRAILGASMGGHGAMTLLARHPELFAGAGSIAGIMDLSEFPTKWHISEVLGRYEQNKVRWAEFSFVGMARNLQGKSRALVFDCGLSDFALPGNRKAHALLTSRGIAHRYRESPGAHNAAFTARVIEGQIAFLAGHLAQAR